ncbi:MAG: peptidoglycan-associated lipoprotein Pal [Pseudomonadales bacterium]|nr:peptidoglycan-associated lipoprotein Pal [Pseudomonadales bacterium]
MGMVNTRGILALGLSALLLVGCASNPAEEENASTSASEDVAMDSSSGMDSEDSSDSGMSEPTPPAGPRVTSDGGIVVAAGGSATEALNVVFYFDFDQAIVKRSGHAELDKHAKALMQDRSIKVRLEGHADERGTREYNLALGERRANALRAYIVAQGVSRSQIEVISYGEEKPAVLGGGESSWAQNRRVRFNYR